MVEWMDNIEMAIQKVCASKVYTSAEFKREKDNFQVPVMSSSHKYSFSYTRTPQATISSLPLPQDLIVPTMTQ
jgi:hypothetical protein